MSNKGASHLKMAERLAIEEMLAHRESIAEIARALGRDWATVAREIKAYRTAEARSFSNITDKNLCIHRDECAVTGLCGSTCPNSPCARCAGGTCNRICESFEHVGMCPGLKKAPYVCNGCRKRLTLSCTYENLYYDARAADAAAKWKKEVSRAGIDCTEEELAELVALVKPLIRQGQSLAHIWQTHYGRDIKVSMRTFYRYVDAGVLDITNLDLPRKVRYKKRKKGARREVPFRPNLEGRTYADFCALDDEERMSCVEMDCVESGRGSEKAILTLLFRRFSFQLMVMLPAQTQECVARALDWVEMLCGKEPFGRLFGVILTDRGHEFIDPSKIETGIEGDRRCRVYYCDPLQSGQKGRCEKNHVELRRILPKGTCFEGLGNAELSVVCSHVNSYSRPKLGGATPYQIASRVLPKDLLEGMGIVEIPPDEVIMRPSIFKELEMGQARDGRPSECESGRCPCEPREDAAKRCEGHDGTAGRD